MAIVGYFLPITLAFQNFCQKGHDLYSFRIIKNEGGEALVIIEPR